MNNSENSLAFYRKRRKKNKYSSILLTIDTFHRSFDHYHELKLRTQRFIQRIMYIVRWGKYLLVIFIQLLWSLILILYYYVRNPIYYKKLYIYIYIYWKTWINKFKHYEVYIKIYIMWVSLISCVLIFVIWEKIIHEN